MGFKVIFNDNGTLSDKTTNILNYYSGTELVPYVLSEDFLYIGARFPFNSFNLKVSVANTQSANLVLKYWDSANWRDAVEIIDETATVGATLATDGRITFVPDKHYGWHIDDTVTSPGTERITGLGNVTIYDHYWLRLSFSASLDATTALSWIGHIFSNDNELGSEYPDLDDSNLRTAMGFGSNWEETTVRAGSLLVDDLVSKGIIESGNQLLDRRKLINSSVSKTAELIYRMRGDDYKDDAKNALAEYSKRINKKIFIVDKDNDATIDRSETNLRSGTLSR